MLPSKRRKTDKEYELYNRPGPSHSRQHSPPGRGNRHLQHQDIRRKININCRSSVDYHQSQQRNFSSKCGGIQYNNKDIRIKRMSFLALDELVKFDAKDILVKVNQRKDALFNLLDSPIESPDIFILIMKLLAKACQSSFDQIKLNLLLDTCNSQFISNLRNYLMDLPYCDNKSKNGYYWDKPIEFWKDFITFSDCIVTLSPSTANKCRSLIDATTKCCLEGLKERHDFVLPEEDNLKLIQVRESLALGDIQKETEKRGTESKFFNADEQYEPPENFRELSVVPRREDLVASCRPYLRANVVKGSYRDVEHYLDVQFRLLREDCFGPLRDGIEKYKKDPTKHKYENIRVFRNVEFDEPYVSSQKVGSVVKLDEKTMRKFRNIKWSHSKLFVYGSLVLFTKDNCNSFIVATILERDEKYLKEGKIPVSIIDLNVEDELYNNDKYTMIESEVYFEPYYHVLKAMQDPNFPKHIAMKKYIIDVNIEPSYPSYIVENTIFKVNIKKSTDKLFEFKFHDFATWPSSKDLNLNESQYEAYKTCLTQEFAVVQGPPGTGKTHLGVKVAKTLLTNVKRNGCLMLVVCYTNHALDQFLEEISTVTKSIVRIGGRSRNEAMQEFNLTNIRKHPNFAKETRATRGLFFEQRQKLRANVKQVKHAQEQIDSILDGIINYKCIIKYIPEVTTLGEAYKRITGREEDPLCHWLFQHVHYDLDETMDFISSQLRNNKEMIYNEDIDDDTGRYEVVLDNLQIDEEIKEFEDIFHQSFSVKETEKLVAQLISYYYDCNNFATERDLLLQIAKLRARIKFLDQVKKYYYEEPREYPVNIMDNPTRLRVFDRWMLYFSWVRLVVPHLKEEIKPLQKSLTSANTAYEEARMILDIEMIKGVQVVGMTTSGAARLRKLLKALAPPIMIVEEAAEVLEQHIITSLTANCKHLILIGDHQQLRPSAAYLRLAKDFKIEVSLFERMIMNSVHSRRLTVQHRMRPEIAALISPHIYPELLNHPSVSLFPEVRGVAANVFFFTHTYCEENTQDNASKTNRKEADLTLQLANYIMQQEYQPEDVTILTAYSGQMFYMRQKRNEYAFLSKVKITVVDNYQGEESKIILLSLVRNNPNTIGFLGIANRVCVALSRAREGFYIFGNIDLLKEKSELWTNIAVTLENQGSLGSSLQLKCENHETQITTVSSAEDFKKVPEGGCLLNCKWSLPCGHPCPRVCHGYDRGHSVTKCKLKCERTICDQSHVCPLMCQEKCEPCMQLTEKTLPCGHSKEIYCHQDPASAKIDCLVTSSAMLPDCGHEIEKPCAKNIKDVKCTIPCEFRIESCGHVCVRNCHVKNDPYHLQYRCRKPCARTKKGCTLEKGNRAIHMCNKKCWEPCDDCNVEVDKKRQLCKHTERVACSQSADETSCLKKCERRCEPCGHSCSKICFEDCNCNKYVVKKIPECGHDVKVKCNVEATPALCVQKCERTLACGHRCRDLCRRPCDEKNCDEQISQQFDSLCGHKVKLPCKVYASFTNGDSDPYTVLHYCRAACGAMLECGHECTGDCSLCRRGRLHAPCTKRCSQINICGHECSEPCNQLCPPCKKHCEVKCAHSRCQRSCGEPCVPCQEYCNRACPHGRCTRRCSEECSMVPCRQRCPLRLACGHACRGLCGERCPDACAVCRPDTFPTDLLGDPFSDDTILIVLEDCGHIMDFEDLENLMSSQTESVTLRACPLCRKPIINTPIYKDQVNRQFKTEINPIKEQVYGGKKQIMAKKLIFYNKIKTFPAEHGIYKDQTFVDWRKVLHKLLSSVKNKNKPSLLQMDMFFVCLDILDMLSEVYKNFKSNNLKLLESELVKKNSLICRVLMRNMDKISQQQQMDISKEITRMHSIVQFAKILEHPEYKTNELLPDIATSKKTADEIILGWGIFDKNKAMETLKNLQIVIKVSGIVTEQEKNLIIRAMSAKAGSWYKCPNGHFYHIANCGGAMQIGKCIECKASVGGTSHTLLSDNQHAREFDNSRFAAWSEAANNMANFDLNNLH